MDGIAEWNGLRNRSGNNFVNFVDMTDVVDFTPGPGTVIVHQRSINANGQAGCAGGELYLRLQRFLVVNDIGRVPTVAAHEAGHLLELDHTGLDDNYDGISSQAPPTMATCLASGATDTRAIGNDDAGHMTDRHDSTTSSDRVTANPSFENQLDYWEEYLAGGAAVHTSLGVTDSLVGSFHMRFRHDVGGSRVQSVTRVANAGGRTFDARASFKRMNSSHTGRVTLTVVYQNVDYGPGSGTNCS
ncbi:MAG: hypothetical protein R2770_18345 [Acidimicrobiales bacterium]